MLIIFLFLQSETTFKYIYLYFHLQILTERIYIFTMSDKNWEICCTKRDNIQAIMLLFPALASKSTNYYPMNPTQA